MSYSHDPMADLLGTDDLGQYDFDYDESAGEDPFVGAQAIMTPRVRVPKLVKQFQSALSVARAAEQQQRDVRIDRLSKSGDLPTTYLAVDSVQNVAAGAALNINVQSVSPVRLIYFTVDPTVAPLFGITGILVGRLNLFMNALQMPASRFIPGAHRSPIEAPILPASVNCTVQVINNSPGAARFTGVFDCIDLGRRKTDCS